MSGLAYQPALDGLRGVAVAAVLGFHLELGWLSGGYLGVSVFFTLSGFLITSLLLAEHDRDGRVSLPGFYQRRARRLIPAGLLTLALVCALVAFDLLQARSTFRRDVIASMTQVLNWVNLFGGQSYADLFTAPSPVTHFWSLGIEEQFYVLWPLTMVLLLRFTRRRAAPQRLVWLIGGLWVVAVVAAPLTARWWSNDAAYYATWARAAEVLCGAVLAAFVFGRSLPRWVRWLAPLALLAMGVAVVITPAGHGWAFSGGLPLFGVVSALLIAALQVPGVGTVVLSWRPLVWLGQVSYGLYLFHWPVFLMLDHDRTGLRGVALVVVRLAVTTLAAALSFVMLERPIRQRRFLKSTRALTGALVGGVAVVGAMALLVEVPAAALPRAPIVIAVQQPARAPQGQPAPEPVVMAIFGDSVPAWLLRDAAPTYARTDVVVVAGASEACDGMIGLPVGRDKFGALLAPRADCQEWNTWYPTVLDRLVPEAGFDQTTDVAVLVLGQAPVIDHLIDGVWLHPCDSIDWYLDDISARIRYLDRRDIPVVFAVPARLGVHSTFLVPDDYVRRMGCVRRGLLNYLRSNDVPYVDLDDVLCPSGNCEAYRAADGVHVEPPYAPQVLDWLIEQVLLVRAVP